MKILPFASCKVNKIQISLVYKIQPVIFLHRLRHWNKLACSVNSIFLRFLHGSDGRKNVVTRNRLYCLKKYGETIYRPVLPAQLSICKEVLPSSIS